MVETLPSKFKTLGLVPSTRKVKDRSLGCRVRAKARSIKANEPLSVLNQAESAPEEALSRNQKYTLYSANCFIRNFTIKIFKYKGYRERQNQEHRDSLARQTKIKCKSGKEDLSMSRSRKLRAER